MSSGIVAVEGFKTFRRLWLKLDSPWFYKGRFASDSTAWQYLAISSTYFVHLNAFKNDDKYFIGTSDLSQHQCFF